MASILVTGGAGFIGSHVVAELLQLGHRVVVLDDLSGGRKEHLTSEAEFVVGSVVDGALIENLFATNSFECVFHFAAFAAEGLSHFRKHHNYSVNVMGSVNLINAAIKYHLRAFVFASSIAVYGDLPSPLREDSSPKPVDSYGIAKLAIEQDLQATRQVFGLPFVILRLHNVYGERQNVSDRYRNVITIFLRQVLTGEDMTIFGDGVQTRAFTHIDDVAPCIARCIDVPEAFNQIINLGGDEVTSVLHLSRLIADAVGVPWRVRHEPPRHEIQHAFADHTKARTLLGFSPRVSLREGLGRTLVWLKEKGLPQSSPELPVEIAEGLPPIWRTAKV